MAQGELEHRGELMKSQISSLTEYMIPDGARKFDTNHDICNQFFDNHLKAVPGLMRSAIQAEAQSLQAQRGVHDAPTATTIMDDAPKQGMGGP